MCLQNQKCTHNTRGASRVSRIKKRRLFGVNISRKSCTRFEGSIVSYVLPYRLIYRPIMLRLRLNEERATYQNYRKAQNSPRYQRVGSRGTDLLNQSTHTLKGRVEWVDRDYKHALQKLCDFEESFDFPMHILATRKGDIKNVKGELAGLKKYVKNVGTCVDIMASAVEDIVSGSMSFLEIG